MRSLSHRIAVLVIICGSSLTTAVQADVFNMGPGLTSLELVTVGNPGNPGELSGVPNGRPRVTGAAPYTYQMGKYEVTAAQYTEFLNAVAADDVFSLYDENMWNHPQGCKIERLGSPGSYSYRVASDRANRPVNAVSPSDAMRFANWLTNGQPGGLKSTSVTDSGSYDFTNANAPFQSSAMIRDPGAIFVVPNEDEWYKAAYHKNDGPTVNYYDYPMSSDAFPGNSLDPAQSNNANILLSQYAIGSPYWWTEVGTFASSPSPYGTFDQGGNIYEYTEDEFPGTNTVVVRGGSALGLVRELRADQRIGAGHTNDVGWGFRVAMVPEPTTVWLFLVGGLVLMRRRPRVTAYD